MRKNDSIRITVTDMNNLGCGVGHLENAGEESGKTVFLRGGVTGDVWEAVVIKATAGYLVAKPQTLLSASPLRVDTDPCEAHASCGGCAYRRVSYEHELDLKRGYVQAAFRKAGLADAVIEAVRSTKQVYGYRNKAQYPVQAGKDGRMEAGFYANSSHRIVSVKSCALQPAIFSEIVAYVLDFCNRHAISAYNEETGRGLLRHIYLREGVRTGEVMVCLVATEKRLPKEETLAQDLTEQFPTVASVMLNHNPKNTNVVLGETYRCLAGKDYIEDILCGLRFSITPQSFYQVNHDACELLYGIAKERAELTGKEPVIDLYCGIGSIGLSMADRASEVLGMEIVESAVACAKENAGRNGIANASFFCGDAGDPKGLLEIAEREKGDLSEAVVILDPPRKGTTKELIEAIAEKKLQRVVYVSCNPDTLARDCAEFVRCGYQMGSVTPVDLFPRTGHVESLVCLTRQTN